MEGLQRVAWSLRGHRPFIQLDSGSPRGRSQAIPLKQSGFPGKGAAPAARKVVGSARFTRESSRQVPAFFGRKGVPLGHLLHSSWHPSAPGLSSAISLPLAGPGSEPERLALQDSGYSNLALQEEGFILELLRFYRSGLVGKLGCVCSWTIGSGLQGKGEFVTHRERENGGR